MHEGKQIQCINKEIKSSIFPNRPSARWLGTERSVILGEVIRGASVTRNIRTKNVLCVEAPGSIEKADREVTVDLTKKSHSALDIGHCQAVSEDQIKYTNVQIPIYDDSSEFGTRCFTPGLFDAGMIGFDSHPEHGQMLDLHAALSTILDHNTAALGLRDEKGNYDPQRYRCVESTESEMGESAPKLGNHTVHWCSMYERCTTRGKAGKRAFGQNREKMGRWWKCVGPWDRIRWSGFLVIAHSTHRTNCQNQQRKDGKLASAACQR
ncbi:hypothetical protein EDD85DRAFT_790948 [Armillaria nabsnona]|nr:hypothetical protein EDD85DRAFT_790948 [Armillaria nabsnona]